MRETVARISATFTNGRHLRDGSSTATNDAGASSVEYGLLVAAIAAVIVAIIFALGVGVKNTFNKTSSCVSAGASSTC
ncbi:MAG TPA: Flp family type IVb pilin [Actinobacteria bacterium]|nr:Flp family type IVb pilin [Actinomycetota bacterium]